MSLKESQRPNPTPSDPEREEEIEILVNNKLTLITSSSTSPTRKYILVTTQRGFILVNPLNAQFTRFQGNNSPFYKNQSTPYGARLGSVLQSRNEVALVPNFSNKKYSSTAVYIYDYSIRVILSTFDFILPIQHFTLTDRYLVASNNKRIVLYNYLKGSLRNNEKQYLQTYRSQENLDSIRYLQLDCHLYDPEKPYLCRCGNYVLARRSAYLKIFYLRVSIIQNSTVKSLYYYDEAVDKTKPFGGNQTFTEDFEFNLCENGRYLIIAEDFGRRLKVFNLVDNCLHTVLHLSRNPKPIINLGIITLPNKTEWVIASRQKENDEATMHIFKLERTPPTEHIESNFKRYFRLYKQLSVSQEIFAEKDKFLGPQYYLIKQKLYCLALEGEFCQLIDLDRQGLHQKVHVKDYRRLQETPSFLE